MLHIDLLICNHNMQPHPSQSLALPIAIVLGFGIIAATIYSTSSSTRTATPLPAQNTTMDFDTLATQLQAPIQTVTADDFIRGNPSAPVMLVTYTSFECPSCRNFHFTMNRIMQNYGPDGTVAWVFRPLPIDTEYPNDSRISEIAMCVGDTAGNTVFWEFVDLVFAERDALRGSDVERLPELVTQAGASAEAVNTCIENGAHREAVLLSSGDAIDSGAFGAPYTVVLAGNDSGVINGPQSYAAMVEIVQGAINTAEENNGN